MSEAWSKTLIDSLPFDVFVVGSDGRYVMQNDCSRNNWGDIIGKRPEDFCCDKETLALWKSNNARAFAGETVEEEVSFRIEGEEKRFHIIISPIHENGAIVGVVGINIDVTAWYLAEQHLRVSESRYRSLVEQTSDAVFCYEYDPPIPTSLPIAEQVKRLHDGFLLECNDVCARSYGARTASEVIGRPLLELFGTEPGSLDGLFGKMIRSGYRTTDEEGVEVLEDGTKRYFLNNGHGVIEGGQLVRVWGTFRDITAQKHTELAFRAEKEFTETALDAQKDTFFVFDPKTGRAIRWNKAFREASGYSDDEIRSMKAPDSYYSEEDLKNAAAEIERLSENDATVVEMSLICKSGKTIPTEYIGSAIRDEKGDLQYIIAIGRDITQRRQMEEALRRLNDELEQRVAERTMEVQRYRLAFENARDAIFWADPETGLVLECNGAAERLLEKNRDEILEKHMATLHTPKDRQRYVEIFEEHVAKGDKQEREAFIVTRSGKEVPVLIYSSVISVGDTSVIQGIYIDNTESKFAEEALIKQRETLARLSRTSSLGQLMVSVAHELNQPLAGILCNAQAAEIMMKKDLWDKGQIKDIMGDIVYDTRRAGEVIRNQRELYREQKGEFIPIDINSVIDETLHLLHREFIAQHIEITTVLSASLPRVNGNRIQIQQVLVNIILNSNQAMSSVAKKKRWLHIESAMNEKEVKVWVEDNGTGIETDMIDQIFEPLITWRRGGTGMGLAISNSIIEMHGGTMWAENRPEGGARVGFTIPVLKESQEV